MEDNNGHIKDNGTIDKDKILRKVEKLLKLAGGTSFEAEAKSAMEQAGRILARYGFELSDIKTQEDIPDQIARENVRGLTHRRRSWESGLATGIAKAFRSRSVIFRTFDPEASKEQWNVAFFGLPSDLSLVTFFYSYLRINIGRRAKIEFPKDVAGRNSFSLSASWEVVKRLKDMERIRDQEVPVDCKDLVPVVEAEVENKIEADFGKTRNIAGGNISDRDGYLKGKQYGKTIPLSRPLANGKHKDQLN